MQVPYSTFLMCDSQKHRRCASEERETPAHGQSAPANDTPPGTATRHPAPAHLPLDAHAAVRFLNHTDVIAAVTCGHKTREKKPRSWERRETWLLPTVLPVLPFIEC